MFEIRDRHAASLLLISSFLLNCTGCIRLIIFHTDSFESYLYFCAQSYSYHLSSYLTSINYDIPYRKWELPSTIYFPVNSYHLSQRHVFSFLVPSGEKLLMFSKLIIWEFWIHAKYMSEITESKSNHWIKCIERSSNYISLLPWFLAHFFFHNARVLISCKEREFPQKR